MFVGGAGSDFLVIFFLIICILNIILFFKVWGMTNDVNSIKRILQGEKVIEELDDGDDEVEKAVGFELGADNYGGDDSDDAWTNDNEDGTGIIIMVTFAGIFIIIIIAFIAGS